MYANRQWDLFTFGYFQPGLKRREQIKGGHTHESVNRRCPRMCRRTDPPFFSRTPVVLGKPAHGLIPACLKKQLETSNCEIKLKTHRTSQACYCPPPSLPPTPLHFSRPEPLKQGVGGQTSSLRTVQSWANFSFFFCSARVSPPTFSFLLRDKRSGQRNASVPNGGCKAESQPRRRK